MHINNFGGEGNVTLIITMSEHHRLWLMHIKGLLKKKKKTFPSDLVFVDTEHSCQVQNWLTSHFLKWTQQADSGTQLHSTFEHLVCFLFKPFCTSFSHRLLSFIGVGVFLCLWVFGNKMLNLMNNHMFVLQAKRKTYFGYPLKNNYRNLCTMKSQPGASVITFVSNVMSRLWPRLHRTFGLKKMKWICTCPHSLASSDCRVQVPLHQWELFAPGFTDLQPAE